MDITEQLTHESRIALAAAAEITRLRAEVEALRNENIKLHGWHESASQQAKAEQRLSFRTERDALKAEVEALRSLARELVVYDNHQTEYDGRMVTICPDCGEQDGSHTTGCVFVRAKAQIDAARAAQGGRG